MRRLVVLMFIVCVFLTACMREDYTSTYNPQVSQRVTDNDITSVTRLNDQCVVLTFEKSDAKSVLYRSQEGGGYTYLGYVDKLYYYDWAAPEGDTCNYYLRCSNGIRTEVREVGYNAKPVTNVAAIMYHYFLTEADIKKGNIDNSGTILVKELESDLKYLKEKGIRTITCDELIDFWNGKIQLPEKCVMLTVDDGHYSIIKYMAPLLEKYNCKANVAIIGEYSTELAPLRNEKTGANCWMTWEEIEKYAKKDSFCFGSHSNYMHNQDRNGRYGIKIKDGEDFEAYKQALLKDMQPLNKKLQDATGYTPSFMAVPFNNPSSIGLSVLTDDLGYKVILVGDSDYYCPTKGNCYVSGIGEESLESRQVRRFARRKGDDFGMLLETIWDNK